MACVRRVCDVLVWWCGAGTNQCTVFRLLFLFLFRYVLLLLLVVAGLVLKKWDKHCWKSKHTRTKKEYLTQRL